MKGLTFDLQRFALQTKEINGVTYTYEDTQVSLNSDGKTFVYIPNNGTETVNVTASKAGTTIATYTLTASGNHIVVNDENTVLVGAPGVKLTVDGKTCEFGAGSGGCPIVFENNALKRITIIRGATVTFDNTVYSNETATGDGDRNVHLFFENNAVNLINLSGVKDSSLKAGSRTYSKTVDNAANIQIDTDGSLAAINPGITVKLSENESYAFTGNSGSNGSMTFEEDGTVRRIGLNKGATLTATGTHANTYAATGANVSICFDEEYQSTADHYFALAAGAKIEVGKDGNKQTYSCTGNVTGENAEYIGITEVDFKNNAVVGIYFLKNRAVKDATFTDGTNNVTYTYTGDSKPSADVGITFDNASGLVTLPDTVSVTGLSSVTIDGTTSYYTTQELADAAVTGKTKITIDGTTKYYTTQALADAAVKDLTIAKIGDDNYYTTLQEAVNAVESGGIITLLKDATGGGIATYTNLSDHDGYAQAKSFTIDFGGHIYTIGSPTVGSTGYETQAFHLEAGSNTSNPVSVTFKNGKITSSAAKMLVQNYSNLTLENMTLDGSELVDTAPYTLSNNNGTVTITNSTITARDGGYAFDLYVFQSYPKVNVTVENSTINGKVELARSSSATHEGYGTLSLTINSGNFNGDLTGEADALLKQVTINGGVFNKSYEALGIETEVTIDGEKKYCKSLDTIGNEYIPVTIDGTTSYYSTQALADEATTDCIAKIGDDNYYTTLQAAVNAVKAEETITLLKDATGNGVQVALGKNFTLDFDEHTYDVDGTTVGSTGTETQAFQLLKDSNITFKNGTITSSVAKMLVQNYSNLTLENMTLDGSKLVGTAPYTSSNNNGTINVTGNTSIIAKEGGYAFDVSFANTSYPTGPQVTIDTTGEIGAINFNTWKQGGDEFKGNLTIKNGTIGDITIDDDALTLGALDKITIEGGTFANSAIKAGATLLVVDNVLVAEGWNSVSDKFVYIKAPESGNEGTKLITVSGIDSDLADQLKFDETNKVFAVPTSATATVNDSNYKLVTVAYDANSTTATVSTTEDAIEITEKLLADTVTKISASGNTNTVYISGGKDVNSIVGGDKDDTLTGSNANVTLTGGKGADIFVAGGNITVTDYGLGSDKISVGADAVSSNVKVNGQNLVLTFDDGKTVNLLGAADKVVTVTNGESDSYYSKDGETSGDGSSVTLPASKTTYTVKDPIKNVDGSNTSGVVITGDKSNNSLIGSASNDKLLGNAGDDTLSGGTGGKDTFTGGKGNDVFVYAAGNAIITDYSASGTNGADKISVGAAPSSFKFSGANLVLNFNEGKDTLTLIGAKNKALTFIDGDGSTLRTYIDNGAVSEGGKITLDQNFKGSGQNISKLTNVTQIDASEVTRNLNLVGNNKGNTLTGGKGKDSLTGGTGNDQLTGGKGKDSLTGGTGNDQLTGGDDADVFIYGGGADTVTDYKSADSDTVKLNKGYSIKSATFGEDDVVFTLNAAGNVVTLTGAAKDTVTVKDASNKVWTYTKDYTAQGAGVTLQAATTEFNASTNDWKNFVTLDGSAVTEGVKLTGNAKNNVFVGSDGADTFVYSAGNDTITNLDSSDTVQVGNLGDVTAAKFNSGKTVLTVGKGSLTFKGNPTSINLVDANDTSATLTNAGISTSDGIQLFNGTKTYTGTADNVNASNVKNNITLAGGKATQTFTGAPGKTVYTYSGTETMTIANYAANDKISVKGSVTNFAVADGNVTLTITNGSDTGSIVLQDAANKIITLHDNADKSGKYTARAYLQTGVTADKAITAVTLESSVTEYTATDKVKQITYKGGEVTISNFNTTKGKINHGKHKITDVTANSLTFDGTGNTLTLADHAASDKVQLAYTNDKGKTVNSTVYLGEHTLTDTTGTKVSVTGDFEAEGKVKTVTALGDTAIKLTGNALNNTLTANDKGSTLDGGAGTDVLIGGDGKDVFIHDKTTGTTTINGYSTGDSISLSNNLSVVGSAYSPGKKNGSLTLTVANSYNASTSKIVINSTDFTKAKGTTYGTVTIGSEETSFGKNAIYSDGNKVELLPTYSGKFTASAGAQVDGSEVTKSLTLQGTTGKENLTGGSGNDKLLGNEGDDTLTGGSGNDTLTGGKGNDELHGGDGKDVFTYSKGDGDDVIADFTCNQDKLKVSTGKLIKEISVNDNKNLKFTMNDGGSVTIEDIAKDDFFIKANGTLYWFDDDDKLVTASDKATKNKLSAIIKAPTDYAIVELDYGTNLVSAGIASTLSAAEAATFSADTFKTT